MDFKQEKILRRLMELSGYRYKKNHPVQTIYYLEDETKMLKYPPDPNADWKIFNKKKGLEGRDSYYWFKCSVTLPDVKSEERAVVLMDFTKFIGGRVRELEGYEVLAFVNGKIYQGMDQNHKELFLDASYTNQSVELSFKLWTGLEAGGPIQEIDHRLNYLNHAFLCKETDDLYFNSKLLYKTVMGIKEDIPEKETLLDILDQTFLLLDWSRPGSDLFYESVAKANRFITDQLEQLKSYPVSTVTGIGHTHIDVAWLWRLKHTREKAARSFSTVMRLMENYPDYTFLQSQPQLYEYIKEDYPELYEEMKDRIQEGRWEADGATWLEPDCNIPSGESLVRQLLFGSIFFRNEFGKEMNYLWLPDVFGYSWALPQILKKSGIDMLMTTKLSWNQTNRMPNDTFIWKGIDGSEVYTYFITTPNPNSADTSVGAVYSGLMEPATVKGIYTNYNNKALNKDFLLAYGHGDGGGGTDREMVEMIERMSKYAIPTLPKVKTGTAKTYFDHLKQTLRSAKENEVETWDGELYLEYHRGTYTSQAVNKEHNRRLELLYRDVEWMSSVSSLNHQTEYPAELLNKGWKVILRNQFHDILPGCSIKEVYEDSEDDYSAAYKYADDVMKLIYDATTDENSWTIVNSAAWSRSELVWIPGQFDPDTVWIDQHDKKLKAVNKTSGSLVYVSDISAFDSRIISSHLPSENSLEEGKSLFESTSNKVDTPYYVIEWDKDGKLSRMYDKENDRDILKGAGNVFELFEDKPMAYDAWDIDIYYQEKGKTLSADRIEVSEYNDLYCKVTFFYSFGESSISQDMILYSQSKRIDFETHVGWYERQQVLKVGFNVDIRSVEATYDIQFGYAKRPTHWNTSWDKARFESVGHQWVDLSETGYGVSLLNNSKYGHDIKDNRIRLTLLTGAIDPNPEADLGEHLFVYSLFPHKGDLLNAKTPEEAWELNNPLHVVEGIQTQNKRPVYFESEASVFLDAFKQAEDKDGFVVRFHDHTGGSREIVVRLDTVFTQWCESNLLEKPVSDWSSIQDNTIRIKVKPFEIVTLRLK